MVESVNQSQNYGVRVFAELLDFGFGYSIIDMVPSSLLVVDLVHVRVEHCDKTQQCF